MQTKRSKVFTVIAKKPILNRWMSSEYGYGIYNITFIYNMDFKDCIRHFFASLFCKSNEETCEARKNVFYFTSKALFIYEIIKF